jgi:hypothetical protein
LSCQCLGARSPADYAEPGRVTNEIERAMFRPTIPIKRHRRCAQTSRTSKIERLDHRRGALPNNPRELQAHLAMQSGCYFRGILTSPSPIRSTH